MVRSPVAPTTSKLIPIVTTAAEADPVTLAQWYTARWPMQENIIKDWLLPLGLEVNHGFGKTPTTNSEIPKHRAALERRLERVRTWAVKAHDRSQRASQLATRLWKASKAWGEAQYQELNHLIQTVDDPERLGRRWHPLVRERKEQIDDDLHMRWERYHHVFARRNQEYHKQDAIAANNGRSYRPWRIWRHTNGRCMRSTTTKTI